MGSTTCVYLMRWGSIRCGLSAAFEALSELAQNSRLLMVRSADEAYPSATNVMVNTARTMRRSTFMGPTMVGPQGEARTSRGYMHGPPGETGDPWGSELGKTAACPQEVRELLQVLLG